MAVRGALARYRGGKVVPEDRPKERASRTARWDAGKTFREFVRFIKENVEDYAKAELSCDDVVVLWMVRRGAMMGSR